MATKIDPENRLRDIVEHLLVASDYSDSQVPAVLDLIRSEKLALLQRLIRIVDSIDITDDCSWERLGMVLDVQIRDELAKLNI